MDSAILAAEESAMNARTRENAVNISHADHVQLHGGFLNSSNTSRPSRERKAVATNKPKPGSGSSNSRESSKSLDGDNGRRIRRRGRPRLDAKSQTPGERRRTQIRLAQRAYRQRKETTIAELNDKVAELQQIIDKMAKSVAVFQDHAAAAGLQHLNSQLSEDLQNVVLGLSSKASYNAPSQESRAVNEIPILSARTYGTEEASGIHAATRLSGLGTGQRATSLQHTQREIESSWGYTLTSETDSSDSHMADESGYSFYDQEDRSKSDVVAGKTIPDNLNITTDERNLIMSLTNKPLSSPATYSFRESTFARRLLRAAYERAYRVIMDPIRNEKTIAEMCKFTFCFNSIDKVRWWITKMNSTTTKDSLELWSAPQLHLGCAGLHYPRTSLDGDNGVLPSLWAEKEPVGPCRSAVAQTPMPDSMTVQEIIEETGFGGEWFDPNDVEHYLKNKGVFVDERSSLVELGVNEVSAMDLTMARAAEPPASYGSDSSHISPEMPDIQVPNEAPMQGTGAVHPFYTEGGHGIVDMDEEFEVLFGSVPSAPQALDQQSLFHDSYSSWEPVSKKLLDVDKFISTIIEKGVCLGRTPGWRRETIDSAIVTSIQEVF